MATYIRHTTDGALAKASVVPFALIHLAKPHLAHEVSFKNDMMDARVLQMSNIHHQPHFCVVVCVKY